MGNITKFDDNAKLPAHLQELADQSAADWGSGQVSGFPVLSVKGKVFHIVRGDDAELITRPDDEDEAATSLEVVILKTHKGVARVFYREKYEEGSQDKPTCYSSDGITPEDDAEEKQSKQCKTCVHSQWGSRITDNGKKGKACSEVKRLAVAEPGYEDDPMLLRVPPTSLRNWDDYLRKLGKRGFNPSMLMTKVGFDATVSHQLFTFKPTGILDAESAARVGDMQDNDVVEAIIGASPVMATDTEADTEADTEVDEEAPAKPKERTRASRKDKEEEPEEKPKKAARRAEPEEEEEPEEVEEEKPARRRRRAEPEKAEEKPTRRRRAAPEPDEPEKAEEKPKKSAKESATVVDADDDLEGELDDMLGELGFDD